MTTAAFAAWKNRVAPVFDVIEEIHLVEAQAGRILRETRESAAASLPVERVLRLVQLRVDTLVCGAISRGLHAMIAAYGIRVIPFVAGDLNKVIHAWLGGKLESPAFAMPGCFGRGPRRLRPKNGNRGEEHFMIGKKGTGSGQGGGRGQGAGGQGMGRMGGRMAAGPCGFCVCAQCGRKEPHKRGVPCQELRCSECGAVMVRE